MKSLIILKGVAKTEKIKWVEKEGLKDFFLDIDVLRKLYSSPELVTPFKGVLNKSYGDTVYSEFLKVFITKLSKGCLIVLDPEGENLKVFESLAFIFGYTIFYVLQSPPQDYVKKSKSYCLPYYPLKRKEDLKKEITQHQSFIESGKIIIKKYKEVEKYWEKKFKVENYYKVKQGKGCKPVLHVSDIHSNYSAYKLLPSFKNYSLVIFHGDYIDGPEVGGSRKMIDEVLKKKGVIWLEGNHELRLRKQLGLILLGAAGKNKEVRELLYESIPPDYFKTTYKEFLDITPEQAREYLEKLNNNLKLFVILECGKLRYICTHSGLKYIEQISPKYIGNVIYGSRDMNRVDKDFSVHTQGQGYWSVHAHCKYYGDWCIHKFKNVVNLDPPSNEEVIYAEQLNNNWRACQLKK
jgi:hypothetical protein